MNELHFLIVFLIGICISCESPTSTPPALGALPPPLPPTTSYPIGTPIDSLNGVYVYYNGRDILRNQGRHKSADGYNYGLKWQCVEFVKRYYYQALQHRMPNPWGHARAFFNLNLSSGAFNNERGLYQHRNGSKIQPKVNDIVVFGGDTYGHVAIVAKVEADLVELIQQNVGTQSRVQMSLSQRNGRWYMRSAKVLGWLSQEVGENSLNLPTY